MCENRVYTYIFPAISETLQVDKSLLIEVYLRTSKFLDPKFVFIVFRYDEEYMESLKQNKQVENCERIGDTILVKFKLNRLQYSYNMLYLHGKYSEFPKKYKDKILDFHNLDKKSKHYQILYKLPILRARLERELNVTIPDSAELGIKTNIKEEMFIINE